MIGEAFGPAALTDRRGSPLPSGRPAFASRPSRCIIYPCISYAATLQRSVSAAEPIILVAFTGPEDRRASFLISVLQVLGNASCL